MKLTLKNFRCHADAVYEFGDSGLILLSGSSGSGKSSLLKAIIYALYGKLRKPYTFGTSTCKVILEFLNTKIVRTSHPNRLVVNDTLEDDAAQAYIDEKFGANYDEFVVACYIAQKNASSILSMAQTEQIRMIQTLAYDQKQAAKYKAQLKALLKDADKILTEKQAQKSVAQEQCSFIEAGLKPIEFPLTRAANESEDDAIEIYRNRMYTFSKRMGEFLESTAALDQKLANLLQTTQDLDRLQTSQRQTEQKIRELSAEKRILEEKLDETDSSAKKLLERNRELLELHEKYSRLDSLVDDKNSILEEESLELQVQKQQLDETLWILGAEEYSESKTIDEIRDIENQIRDITKFHEVATRLEKLKVDFGIDPDTDFRLFLAEKIVEIEKSLADHREKRQKYVISQHNLEISKQIVQCPKCNTKLKLQDDKLLEITDYTEPADRDYSTLIKKIDVEIAKTSKNLENHYSTQTLVQSLAQEIPTKFVDEAPGDSLQKTLEDRKALLQRYFSKNKQDETEYRKIVGILEGKVLSPTVKKLTERIKKLEEQLSTTERPSKSRDELVTENEKFNEELASYNSYKTQLKRVEIEIQENDVTIRDLRQKVGKLKRSAQAINESAVKKKKKAVADQMEKAKRKQLEDESLQSRVEQYIEYRYQKSELIRWKTQLSKLTSETDVAQKRHHGMSVLLTKYKQAEILALESTIEGINEHTAYYLDKFFEDSTLTARLHPAFSGKTFKLTTQLNYQANEYDNLQQLSGGEFDRCTLASICGVNTMINSPVLILDECLSSLDSDCNTEIISYLKEIASEKLVLVCSHEAIRGIFDEIVEF